MFLDRAFLALRLLLQLFVFAAVKHRLVSHPRLDRGEKLVQLASCILDRRQIDANLLFLEYLPVDEALDIGAPHRR